MNLRASVTNKTAGTTPESQTPVLAPEAAEAPTSGLRAATKIPAYRAPDRWEDHDRTFGPFGKVIGARPVWAIDGKDFSGPRLGPEVEEPRTKNEEALAKKVLFDLWCHANRIAIGVTTDHYHGLDHKGRHAVT